MKTNLKNFNKMNDLEKQVLKKGDLIKLKKVWNVDILNGMTGVYLFKKEGEFLKHRIFVFKTNKIYRFLSEEFEFLK